MPLITRAQARTHRMHGVAFVSYAAPSQGSGELCAWRLEVPAGAAGAEHAITREEVFLGLEGVLELSVDGDTWRLEPGDAAVVGAGSRLNVANPGTGTGAAWVATSTGLRAVTAEGAWISPPWTN
ncbi:cupin domain-containing protein [Streptomonospora halophila]|uniref:Cupin domain-containing protein n=1 Tax=Streptomonospora halophila TaxID=427369 RepID=A0ABP9GBU9_9ACTN